jgi:hypothetical protein
MLLLKRADKFVYLIPCSEDFLENLIALLVKELNAFCGNRKFIAVFTRVPTARCPELYPPTTHGHSLS